MKFSLVLLAGVLMTSSALADTVKYRATFTLNNLVLHKQVASASCELVQNLGWQDKRIFAQCQFNGAKDSVSFAGEAESIGFNYDMDEAYAILDLSAGSLLGRYMLDNGGVTGLSGTNQLKIYFGLGYPFAENKAMFTGPDSDLFELVFDSSGYER